MVVLETIDRTLSKTDAKETSNNSISVKEIEEAMRVGYFEKDEFCIGIAEELRQTESKLALTFKKNIIKMFDYATLSLDLWKT
jgi:hypothetical protein